MPPQDESKALVKHFNSRSRKVAKVGRDHLVPLKYSDDGDILTQETFDIRIHLKRLNLNDWRFLESWRRHEWNIEKATKELDLTEERVKRLVKKLECFKFEEARDRALAAIPSNDWIKARHTENVFDGKLDDSQRDSLKEIAKINGAYKPTTVNLNQNVLVMPQLTAEQEAEYRRFADSIATTLEEDKKVA